MFSSKTRWSQRSWHIFHHSLHRQLPKCGSQNSFIWCPTSGGKKLNFVAVINPQAVFTTINSSIHMPQTTLLWFLWKIFSEVLNCWSIFIKFLVNKNSSSEIYIFVNYYWWSLRIIMKNWIVCVAQFVMFIIVKSVLRKLLHLKKILKF